MGAIDAFEEDCDKVVMIGADIPGITKEIIQEAFNHLDHYDTVLGPALDGGYYLVGIRKDACKDLYKLFSPNIAWGTESVLQEQSDVINKLGLSLQILSAKLSDVDLVQD